MKNDYYKTLGLNKSASAEEIKKAYRKLAMKYHPDRTNGDKDGESKFKDIAEAYSVLSDENKKNEYDNGSFQNFYSNSNSNSNSNFSNIHTDDLNEIFSHFFNTNMNSSINRESNLDLDLDYKLKISLEQAILGAELNIEVNRYENVDSIIYQKIVPIKVKIPKGIEDGMILRLANEGNSSKTLKGDLKLTISINPNPFCYRKDNDLYFTQNVDFITVILGGEIEINAITGKFQITIPHNSKNGMKLRVKGKGAQNIKSKQIGDLYVVINITTPNLITEKQKKLLQQFY